MSTQPDLFDLLAMLEENTKPQARVSLVRVPQGKFPHIVYELEPDQRIKGTTWPYWVMVDLGGFLQITSGVELTPDAALEVAAALVEWAESKR